MKTVKRIWGIVWEPLIWAAVVIYIVSLAWNADGATSADAPEEPVKMLCLPAKDADKKMAENGFNFLFAQPNPKGVLFGFVHPTTEEINLWAVIKPKACLIGKWRKQ